MVKVKHIISDYDDVIFDVLMHLNEIGNELRNGLIISAHERIVTLGDTLYKKRQHLASKNVTKA